MTAATGMVCSIVMVTVSVQIFHPHSKRRILQMLLKKSRLNVGYVMEMVNVIIVVAAENMNLILSGQETVVGLAEDREDVRRVVDEAILNNFVL